MKLLVINGPNLNFLGIREPGIYGSATYADLCETVRRRAGENGDEVSFFQSNHEGDLIDRIQEAYSDGTGGIVLNPGAYTHTSIALADAVRAVGIPTVEVHVSDLSKRENFRQISYVRDACVASIVGHGIAGYTEAMDLLTGRAEKK